MAISLNQSSLFTYALFVRLKLQLHISEMEWTEFLSRGIKHEASSTAKYQKSLFRLLTILQLYLHYTANKNQHIRSSYMHEHLHLSSSFSSPPSPLFIALSVLTPHIQVVLFNQKKIMDKTKSQNFSF